MLCLCQSYCNLFNDFMLKLDKIAQILAQYILLRGSVFFIKLQFFLFLGHNNAVLSVKFK